ncbi:MAG: hypothetical protein Pars2KO_13480 [Parasphingorhabdus sp.]
MLDASYAHSDALYVGTRTGMREIPGEVPAALSGGVNIKPADALTLTAQIRHFARAPLIEDDSVESKSTTLLNLDGYWDFGKLTLGAEVFNAFNARNTDNSYICEPRLASETAGAENLHTHPEEPRLLRVCVHNKF